MDNDCQILMPKGRGSLWTLRLPLLIQPGRHETATLANSTKYCVTREIINTSINKKVKGYRMFNSDFVNDMYFEARNMVNNTTGR